MNTPNKTQEQNRTAQQENVNTDTYDRKIVPAETAARQERERDSYKSTPDGNEARPETRGYTVDKEGLANNYAIEPEMYVNEPGDLRETEAEDTVERAHELEEVNQEHEGDLTMQEDQRGKGPGVI